MRKIPAYIIVSCVLTAFCHGEALDDSTMPEVTAEAALGAVPSAESSDFESVFDEATDVSAEGSHVDLSEQFTKKETISVTGNFSGKTVGALGYTQLPPLDYPYLHLKGNLGFLATTMLALDARPDSSFRLFGSVKSKIDASNLAWPVPVIEELFVDYTLLEDIYFRIGKSTLTWAGQARILELDNLLAGSSDGLSMRVSLPAILDGLSAVLIATKAYFAQPEYPALDEFGYGLRAEKVLLDTYFGIAAFWQQMVPLTVYISLKRAFWGTDVYVDTDVEIVPSGILKGSTTLGLFREWGELHLTTIAECHLTFDGNFPRNTTFGVAAAFRNIAETSIDAGVRWEHSLASMAGRIVPAVKFDPFSHVSVLFGLPVVYGEGYSIEMNDIADPLNRKIAILAEITLSSMF